MKVVIVEDEALAAEQLKEMILEHDRSIQILSILESVEESVEWFRSNRHPDLIFLDIQLEDDLSFSIFEKVEIRCPVIFTTAYDEYAIRAFKFRSIDYLLKPVLQEELNAALRKYVELIPAIPRQEDILQILDQVRKRDKPFRERFSVKVGQKIKAFRTAEVAWFISENGYTSARLKDGKSYDVDLSLDNLEHELDPAEFYRINRKMLVSLQSIREVHIYSSSRLKLDLVPDPGPEVLVSIDRVRGFKQWLDDGRQ